MSLEKREPDFFTQKDLELLAKWSGKSYNKNKKSHKNVKNILLNNVWLKTKYWSEQLTKRLSGYSTYNPRIWSQRGRVYVNGEKIRGAKFKKYTWARIYREKEKDKDIFFTVGANASNKSLLYKLDYYKVKNSRLNKEQHARCKQLIPDIDDDQWVAFKDIAKYNWIRLLDESERYIRKNERKYDEILKSVWIKSIHDLKRKNELFKQDIPLLKKRTKSEKTFTFKGHETDWKKKQKRDIKLGKIGEELVIRYEQRYLKKYGPKNKVSKVKKVKDGEGYDIISFYQNGKPKYIEVKSTKGSYTTPFYVSLNEIEFSKRNYKTYHLYRLFNLDQKSKVAEFHEYIGALDTHFKLEGITYNAFRKN